MIELEEFEPNRWRVKRDRTPPRRSDLPVPHVISDIMDPVEQVDGKFYTSKRQYRAVGRAHGLIEVGNEKPKPRPHYVETRAQKDARRQNIKDAFDKYAAGHRART